MHYTGAKKPLTLDREVSDICFHICELLSFMVKSHQFRSKFFFMGDITKKLLILLKSRETYIRLASLRVFRSCVGTKDEFYVRILLKNDVLVHIMETLRETEERYNLLNSACLEFLEFVRKVGCTFSVFV